MELGEGLGVEQGVELDVEQGVGLGVVRDGSPERGGEELHRGPCSGHAVWGAA